MTKIKIVVGSTSVHKIKAVLMAAWCFRERLGVTAAERAAIDDLQRPRWHHQATNSREAHMAAVFFDAATRLMVLIGKDKANAFIKAVEARCGTCSVHDLEAAYCHAARGEPLPMDSED